jgi:hypothetical protein
MSAAETAYAVLAIVDPGRHVPVPTPQATESGRHWNAKMKMATTDTTERIVIEPMSTLRIRGAIVAIRYKTKATLIFAANWAMRYNNCAITKNYHKH